MIQKDSYKHETYFDIRSLVTAELEELWSWYCFEKVALGVETLQECSTESTLRIFLAQKLPAVQRKDFGEFSKSICSKGKNQNPRGRYPIGRELACQLARTFPFCEPWTIVDRSASMGIQYRTFWKSSGMWIDPGQGFGTGNHLSTALTLEMLEQYLLDADTFPESMIDLGIGQGILAIAAYRLGVPKGQVWILKLKRSLNWSETVN